MNQVLPNYHKRLVQSIIGDFEQALKQLCGDEVRILQDVDITEDMITVDAIVSFHDMLIAVIECVDNYDNLAYVKRDISKIMRRAQIQLGIVITASGTYFLRKATRERSFRVNIESIADEIQSVCDSIKVNLDPSETKGALLALYDTAPRFENKITIRPLFEEACNNLVMSRGRISLQERDEILIMQMILGGSFPEGLHVCRYTSLDGLFKMLDSGKHAMCSPISMNDRNECDYADSYMPWHVKRLRGEVEIEADNSYFLLSCSDIQEMDVLTMWRLYGENAKGVCLEYEVDYERIDNDKYFLGRVNYGQKGLKRGQPNHPELSFIAYMQSTPISPGWYFSFSRWYIWKFFFKSWTYRDEKEIRLIYLPDTSDDNELKRIHWYKDHSNSIFNRRALIPITMFDRKDFPLNLCGIILGPQSPEMARNREQIEYMVSQKGIDRTVSFMVRESIIDNYR